MKASNNHINYAHLRNLLEAGEWQKADRETANIILKLASKEKSGWVKVEDLSKLPCQDLLIIDRLWVKYSRGRFGFSVQKQMWSEANENIVSFGHRIGWCVNNNWLSRYSDYVFSLNAPFGHLPSLKWLSGWRLQEDIWEQEFGFMGRLIEPVFTSGHFVSYLFFNDTQWEGLARENHRAESIVSILSFVTIAIPPNNITNLDSNPSFLELFSVLLEDLLQSVAPKTWSKTRDSFLDTIEAFPDEVNRWERRNLKYVAYLTTAIDLAGFGFYFTKTAISKAIAARRGSR